jgi:hypothetical protein
VPEHVGPIAALEEERGIMSDLDTFGMTRTTDPETSFEAAGKVAPHVRELQAKVGKRLLEVYPDGLTHWEIEEYFGDHGSTYRTRVSELCEMIPPLARNSGRRRHIAGGNRVVWVAKEHYVEMAAAMAEREIRKNEF